MGQYLKTRYPGIFQYVGKNGTVYGIDYYSGGKKHREIVGSLLGETQEKLAEKKAMGKKGIVLSASEKRKITFEKLKEKYCELQKGERSFEVSKKHFVNAVSDFLKDKRLFQITPLDIEQFKKQRKETPVRGGKIRSDVSVNRELEVLRHMLNKAVEWGMLDQNPFTRFKDPIFFEESNDRVRFLEEDKIKKLLDVSPPYLANLIKGAIFTGLRKAEICNLKVEDLKTYRNQAVIDIIGKGRKFRRIPLKTETLLAIKDYLKASGNGTGPDHSIFNTLGKHGSYQERSLTPKAVDCLIKSLAKKALIQKRIHPHVMRHTFATTLLDNGNDLRTVQALMGHSHIRTTERYLHSNDDRKVEAIQSLQFGA